MEIIGGILANSLAIICDAFHLLSDLAGFIISLLSCYLATRQANKTMNFGYRRYEILGAFLSVILIWLLTGGLLYAAITRIIDSNYHIDSKVMIIMASIGVAFNAIMAFVLSYTKKQNTENNRNSRFMPPKIIDSKLSLAEKQSRTSQNEENLIETNPEKIVQLVRRNINLRAAFIHIIGDLLQSFGVLLASLIVFFKPELKIADPLCTISFSVIVLLTTLPIANDIIKVLLESFPKQCDRDELIRLLTSVNGVKSVMDLKVWSLGTDSYSVIARVLVDTSRNQVNACFLNNLSNECKIELNKEYEFIKYVFIELELEDDSCLENKSDRIQNIKLALSKR